MCSDRVKLNIRQYYVNQYGLETAYKIRRLECLKNRRAKCVTSLNFLKRCRDHDIIPVCVQISPKRDIFGSADILRQASKKLLIKLIQQHRWNVHKIGEEVDDLTKDIQVTLSDIDFNMCVKVTNEREYAKYRHCKHKLIGKYNRLRERNKPARTSVDGNVKPLSSVVNLSKQTLDEPTVKVLSKGLNFSKTPHKIPYEDIIANVEDCLVKNKVGKEDLEAIRQDVSNVLRRSKPPKPNLSRQERIALNNLRKNQDVIVLRADKGNATVVMDTSEYNLKMSELLSDTTTYKKVKTDPTNRIVKKTSDLINKYSSGLDLDVGTLLPSCVKPPKLYGLPKIHKQNVPLRPVVCQIDTPTYKLAQHLAKVLSKLRGNTETYVKDSYSFIKDIKTIQINDDESMVSFDVQSLFTSLPIEDCIEIVKRKLNDNEMPKQYAELLEHCLTSGYLLWNDEFYQQIDGVAMGSPVSPVIADIFMEDFEQRALLTAPAKPKIFKRYVDDTFAILPKNKITEFLDHLNSIHDKIKFTMEVESGNSLAFLDTKLIRKPDHTLGHTVYRKPTHTNRYLNGESHHHPSQLATVGKSLFQRARGICDQDHLAEELQQVKQSLRNNKLKLPRQSHRNRKKHQTVDRLPAVLPYVEGVTDKISRILRRASIKTYFKPSNKINQLLRPIKCNIPLQDAGVYKIDCDCGLSYIGQTKRSIKTRIKEHIADMKNNRTTKSAVCEHALKPNHFIRFDKPQVLVKESKYIPRMIREAIEIKKHPNFNREDGWQLPPVWDPVIKIIKDHTKHHTARSQDITSSVCVQRNP